VANFASMCKCLY